MAASVGIRVPVARRHSSRALGRLAMSPRNASIAVCCIFIAIAILVAPVSWGLVKSPVYKGVSWCIICMTAGIAVLYAVFSSLRRGFICIRGGASVSVYSRLNNPFAFWFYVVFLGFLGLFICGGGVYGLVDFIR